MKKHGWVICLALLTLVLTGCLTTSLDEKMTAPLNDRVLTYDLPMDLTYLRTMEALEKVPDWELEETEKEKGWIRIRNTNFSRFDDADKRLITVEVTPVERGKTTVCLSQESQRVIGGDIILNKIDEFLKKEAADRIATPEN